MRNDLSLIITIPNPYHARPDFSAVERDSDLIGSKVVLDMFFLFLCIFVFMKMIKDIFFDLDNTLWDFKKSSEIALKQVFANFGLVAEFKNYFIFQTIYEHHNKQMWIRYYNNSISKENLVVRRFHNSLKERGIDDLELAEDMNRNYMNLCDDYTYLYPKTLETLHILRERGFNLHAISNGFEDVQRRKMDKLGLSGLFSTVTCSETAGVCKPHRGIFDFAISNANTTKEQTLLVGDDINTDIKGAVEYGIMAIHLSSKKEFANRIESIDELVNLLAKE